MLGKRVLDELYVHADAVEGLDEPLKEEVHAARALVPPEAAVRSNVVKVNVVTKRVSLLEYRDFEASPFPILASSWSMRQDGKVSYRSFEQCLNPPILHRKELLVSKAHPRRAEWERLTATAESLGLFDDVSLIGFKLNWERLILSKGYALEGAEFLPIGNDLSSNGSFGENFDSSTAIERHLTALTRSGLSAPVQLLVRAGLLQPGTTLFDYGCGRGGDVSLLLDEGVSARGWDPHFFPANEIKEAEAVNLGFVINVIEDPRERAEALRNAFQLARGVLSVGVMLYGAKPPGGRPFGDGYVTSRNTFQKYFSQAELEEYLKLVLGQEVLLVAPGIAFVFADKHLEQRYCASRYRRKGVVERLAHRSPSGRPTHAPRGSQGRLGKAPKGGLSEHSRASLERLWQECLELGRYPEEDEVSFLSELIEAFGGLRQARRQVGRHYNLDLMEKVGAERADDLRVYFAMQHFSKRPPYKSLERRLQLDVQAAFGGYKSASIEGLRLLSHAAEPELIYEACSRASSHGLGWLDEDHSLQLHTSLVERLPALLRVYVACGLRLYGELGETDVVKIHIRSGKVSLLQFDDFLGSPLPRLIKRVKIDLRKLDYDTFEYMSPDFPPPVLYRKSRYMHEDMPEFGAQSVFDASLDSIIPIDEWDFGPSEVELRLILEQRRRAIDGFKLVGSTSFPDLDAACGENFTYRDFIECGETQSRTGVRNLPANPATYNALYDLSTKILDPIIDYFGAIRLTYGFCSAELGRHIKKGVAPSLDQHAACELNAKKMPICARGGAACDFLVEDENMEEVAEWIIANLPFDRLYFYGSGRPIHISYCSNPAGEAYAMRESSSGRRFPVSFQARGRRDA